MAAESFELSCSLSLVAYNYSETSDKDTPKEDKPPNKGQAKSTFVCTLYRKSPLKEANLSTKDKTAGPDIIY